MPACMIACMYVCLYVCIPVCMYLCLPVCIVCIVCIVRDNTGNSPRSVYHTHPNTRQLVRPKGTQAVASKLPFMERQFRPYTTVGIPPSNMGVPVGAQHGQFRGVSLRRGMIPVVTPVRCRDVLVSAPIFDQPWSMRAPLKMDSLRQFHTYRHQHIHTYSQTYIQGYTPKHTMSYIHTCIHTYIHTHNTYNTYNTYRQA